MFILFGCGVLGLGFFLFLYDYNLARVIYTILMYIKCVNVHYTFNVHVIICTMSRGRVVHVHVHVHACVYKWSVREDTKEGGRQGGGREGGRQGGGREGGRECR